MAKKQPLNNRINKEDMFKKIMPSASTRPKPAPAPQPAGGGDLMDGLTDDLIDRTVSSFGDDLLDQLPSQPRVFATPAAPTAPVPPPPTVSVPAFEGYAIGDEQRQLRDTAQAPEPDEFPAEPRPLMEPPAPPEAQIPQAPPVGTRQPSAGTPPQTPEAQGPPPSAEAPSQPFPQPPSFQQAGPPPYFPQGPQNYPYVPTQQQGAPAPFPSYVPTGGYPQGAPYYPPYPYPYPPYPSPAPEAPQAPPSPSSQAPAAPADKGAPVIEQTPSATVVADSASVVTDTVVIQENRLGPAAPPEPAPQRDPRPAPVSAPFEPEEPSEPPHAFQEEMDVSAVAFLLDNYDALPPLSEGGGDVVNVVERIVSVWLDEVIARIRGCACEKCRMDMAAFALNRLNPQYVLTEELREEHFFNRRIVAETVRMLYLAAFQVKTFPRH